VTHTPTVGERAPDFNLRDQYGQEHRLSALRGRLHVLLVFFPFAFTPVCTGELAEISADEATFATDQVRTYGISCDPVASLKAFAEQQGTDVPLLSDFWPHGQVAREYGVFLPEKGFANRGSFIVDREGIVRWSVVTSPSEGRSADSYRDALSCLI